ncbi:unnamed protein product, partial [Rotaria socialis]
MIDALTMMRNISQKQQHGESTTVRSGAMSDSNSNRVGSVSDSVNGDQGSRNNDSYRER